MRKIMFILMLLCVGIAAYSVPALRARRNVLLTDGTRVQATVVGDEYYSCLIDDDGFVLKPSGDGRTYIRMSSRIDEVARVASSRRNAAPRRLGSSATAPLPVTGSPKIPVILIEFADSVFTVADSPESVRQYYNQFCNGTPDGERHSIGGNYGSIRDYFRAQSQGQFTPEFVIIGPVKLHAKASYYGQNDAQGNKDILYAQFRREAIIAAQASYEGDWSDFDNKNQGQVDLVFFIYAGTGENTANKNDYLIWPKEATSTVTVEGIKFATTGCTCENQAVTNEDGDILYTEPDGIGVFCHELSHALGLPDFYDTKYVAFGMDIWSLMDFGCYAGNSRCPSGYNSYELEFMGWRELPTITDNGSYTLEPLNAGGHGVKVVNSENPNEYYILENRQRRGWDQAMCRRDSGMLVIHVDYDQGRWSNNTVNTDAKHQRMTIIAANNRYIGTTATTDYSEIIKTWSGNLYPTDGNDSLTTYSTPAAKVFSSSGFMHKDINHIRINPDRTVSFHFGDDWEVGVKAPEAAEAFEQREWFDLSGRRIDAATSRPSRKGIFVSRGRKHVNF